MTLRIPLSGELTVMYKQMHRVRSCYCILLLSFAVAGIGRALLCWLDNIINELDELPPEVLGIARSYLCGLFFWLNHFKSNIHLIKFSQLVGITPKDLRYEDRDVQYSCGTCPIPEVRLGGIRLHWITIR